jgi:allantoate deiminase
MRELGLQVRSDAVGNLFGRLEGDDPTAVMTGSHIDTVPNGGPLDGALGILGALSAVETLKTQLGRPRRTLEVLVCCEEEGAAYPANYWGARAITGTLDPAEAASVKDADGRPIGDAMRAVGLDPAAIPSARRQDVATFVELHIEQGRLLEDAGLEVGVVGAITGQYRAQVVVEGRPDHAGTTPMDLRSDAYLGAAEMALRVAEIAGQLGRPAVATVGRVRLEPGAVNVVPGRATFSLDARHPDLALFEELLTSLDVALHEIAARRDLAVAVTRHLYEEPTPMSAQVQDLLGETADALGLRWMPMTSGAGHDSEIMARAYPTAMIFVPSQGGRSHRPDEWTPIEQIVPGVRLLAHTLRRLAYDA